jgi:hypothetical protein
MSRRSVRRADCRDEREPKLRLGLLARPEASDAEMDDARSALETSAPQGERDPAPPSSRSTMAPRSPASVRRRQLGPSADE